jgi:DNA-binding MarR family transcriptional regulator
VSPPRAPTHKSEGGRLSSVAAAVRLLKAFSEQQTEIGISDLARKLGVAKSTVHRLAVTLVADGMLEQNPDSGKYRLGISLFRLGSLVRRRMSVSNEARPLLRELREKVNETVHLAVLDGNEIMYVYNLENAGDPHALRCRRAQAGLLHRRGSGHPGVPAARGGRKHHPRRAGCTHASDRHRRRQAQARVRGGAPARLRD